jgi:hypothetical protein
LMYSIQTRIRVVDFICYTMTHFWKCFVKKLYDLISKINCLPITTNNERKVITETLIWIRRSYIKAFSPEMPSIWTSSGLFFKILLRTGQTD